MAPSGIWEGTCWSELCDKCRKVTNVRPFKASGKRWRLANGEELYRPWFCSKCYREERARVAIQPIEESKEIL